MYVLNETEMSQNAYSFNIIQFFFFFGSNKFWKSFTLSYNIYVERSMYFIYLRENIQSLMNQHTSSRED